MSRRTGRTEAGFTLVEMLVSLTLLAMAAALMLEGLGSTQRLWAGEAARTGRGETVEAAQSLLRTRIEGLRPTTRFDAATPFTDMDGLQRQLVFLAAPGDADQPAAARRYRLALGDQGDLLLGAAPVQGEAAYADQVLMRDVEGLDISYYGPDPSGGAAHWQTDWTRRASPPELVRIRLALRSGDRRVWPELIIHPAATVDTLCTIDPDTGVCRGRA